MEPAGERQKAYAELARQLALALSSYRLYPGELTQPGFMAAGERVRAAATVALAGGDVHLEIQHGQMSSPEGDLADNDHITRLAIACFERRVEHLEILEPPSDQELAAFGEALSRTVEEVEAAGDIATLLEKAGVTSIHAGTAQPRASDDELDALLASLSEDLLDLWKQVQDPDRMAANLLVRGSSANPAQTAQDIYRRFRTLHAVLPEELTARKDFFRNLSRALAALPQSVSREFTATVVTRVEKDGFANGYAGDLSDAELARIIVELGRDQGPDPIDVARRVVASTGRRASVVDLITNRLRDQAEIDDVLDAGQVVTATSDSEDQRRVRQSMADALAGRLVDKQNSDATYLRELYPATREDYEILTMLSLRDYLLRDDDLERVERVLDVWAAGVREAVRGTELARLDRLIDVIEDPRAAASADEPRRAAFDLAVDAAVDAALVADLVAQLRDGSRDEAGVRDLLSRFGGIALDAVLDQLGIEEGRGARAQLVSLAVELAPGHLDRILDRVGDPRWYVVRNLVTIIGRIARPEGVAPLVQAANHPHPAVRREVVRSLVACGGGDVVRDLRRLAGDQDDGVRGAAIGALLGIRSDAAAQALADVARGGQHLDERRRAIDVLARHPAPAAPDWLRRLASRRERPKLPRTLRRHARKALRSRGSAGGMA